jgi:hypothetical protein
MVGHPEVNNEQGAYIRFATQSGVPGGILEFGPDDPFGVSNTVTNEHPDTRS